MRWLTGELGGVAVLYDSLHQTPPYTESGYPMVRVTDIQRGYVDTSQCVRVDYETYLKFSKKHRPRQGDILFSRVGSYGNSAFVTEEEEFCLGQNTVCISADRNVIDPYFLYSALNSDVARHQINALVGGVSQGTISLKSIRSITIPLPPLPIQRRIAGILSGYDDLIENNLRRIRILEEMARSIYREWFVDFRFQGRENVSLVDSALGQIPEGWHVRKLKEIAAVNRAQINARTAPERLHYIDISSVSPGQIDSITTYAFSEAPGRARRVVQHGDVIWSCVRPNRRSHALVMKPEADTIASTGFAVLTATEVPFPFLYFATTTDEFVAFLTNHATGAAYPAVTATTFENADILVPPVPLLKRFGDFAIPVAEQVFTLQRKNEGLRTTRDLLLPRLLSGAVDVSGADSPNSVSNQAETPVERLTGTRNRSHTAAISTKISPLSNGANQEHSANQLELGYEAPPAIDQTDRSEVLAVIRQVFSDGQPRSRHDAIRDVAHLLGYGRVGQRIQDVLHTDLLTAVRRGILENAEGELRLLVRSVADYDRDFLKQQFLAAIGRSWIEREEAIQSFSRWMGFRRTGPIIDETALSLINGLLRENRIEANGPDLIRRSCSFN